MNTRMHEKYTGKKIENPDEWMNPRDIANTMLYCLKLPKKVEISEITINRKNLLQISMSKDVDILFAF